LGQGILHGVWRFVDIIASLPSELGGDGMLIWCKYPLLIEEVVCWHVHFIIDDDLLVRMTMEREAKPSLAGARWSEKGDGVEMLDE